MLWTPHSTRPRPTATLAEYMQAYAATRNSDAFAAVLDLCAGRPGAAPAPDTADDETYELHADELQEMLQAAGFHGPVVPLTRAPGPGGAGAATSRHMQGLGLQPVLGVVETDGHFFILLQHHRFALRDLVMFSPEVVMESHAKPLFVVYQILLALQHLHQHGIAHGALSSASVLVDHDLLVTLAGVSSTAAVSTQRGGASDTSPIPRPLPPASQNLRALVRMWLAGALSNFDYLLAINHLAGRRMGDPNNHPILPWVRMHVRHQSLMMRQVMDFTEECGGWRDLSKSKYRLNKGDAQLDITYAEGVSPHHVSDTLTEARHSPRAAATHVLQVTYFVYLARKTPRELLCRYVRSKWVPGEYPSSMQRMYAWTPDCCIPEFFVDPACFRSIHPDLPDLDVPAWASGVDDFLAKHRRALECDHVSEHLHHWIDIMFGYKLAGKAAVEAKNVCLAFAVRRGTLENHGVVQLFAHPHPPKPLTFDPSHSHVPPSPCAARRWRKMPSSPTCARSAARCWCRRTLPRCSVRRHTPT